MSNSIKYYNRYNVKDIYDIFNKNRVNKISLGATNEYISYAVNTEYAYIYARKSSPTINSDEYKNYAYLKVDGTAYNFYSGHAYTYTENVSAQNTEPILIAYDFINKISRSLEFNKVSISHNVTSINNVPQTVNVFSPISYIIENDGDSIDIKDKYSISKDNINSLLNGSTFADFTTYVSYSYLDPTKYDGKVYEDGKDILSANPINHIHVWSLKQENKERISYLNINENIINNTHSYTYISYGNVFSNNSLFTYIDFKLQYPEGEYVPETEFTITTENNEHILKEENNNFYNICNYYTKSKNEKITFAENNNKFNYICEHPSIRNNESEIIAYTYIKGENKENVSYIDNDNYNKVKFEKEIYNLPVNIFHDVQFKIEVLSSTIDGTAEAVASNEGYIENFTIALKNIDGNEIHTINIPITITIKANKAQQNKWTIGPSQVHIGEFTDQYFSCIDSRPIDINNMNIDNDYTYIFDIKMINQSLLQMIDEILVSFDINWNNELGKQYASIQINNREGDGGNLYANGGLGSNDHYSWTITRSQKYISIGEIIITAQIKNNN